MRGNRTAFKAKRAVLNSLLLPPLQVIVVEESSQVACPITTKLVLDEDDETKEPVVQVHGNLVTKLKPHQVDGKGEWASPRCIYVIQSCDLRSMLKFLCPGVQFMWDCCCESVRKIEKSAGSGCILAHCMGLGKTLQVGTNAHHRSNSNTEKSKTMNLINNKFKSF